MYHPVLDTQTALDRLLSPTHDITLQEEERHPWHVPSFQPLNRPLLRVWDRYTGSNPEDGCMMARSPEKRLCDEESRRTSLQTHSDYRKWNPTPYISFEDSQSRVESLVQRRLARGAQMITAIDPNTRLRNGLPFLRAITEMKYYNIPDPYGKNYEYYQHEYLCLWQVTAAEFVGEWQWTDLMDDRNWYHNIILPAYEKFIETAAAGNTSRASEEAEIGQRNEDSIDDLQSSFAKLSATCAHASSPNSDVCDEQVDHSSDDGVEEEDESDHEGYEYDENTDEEVMKANAADNMIKITEGDW
ncbi:hypothetical protein ANO14919_075560 [Xylariales sp. No.14919]|nr:hypothetical protein ANO14919_075560 [Xylariales sp. No.14919]